MSEVAVDENTKSEVASVTAVLSTAGEATKDTTAPQNGITAPEDPPAKKKRTADRQITKDDFDASIDDDDEEDGGEIKHGFKRASAEVLAKRKIVRVRRPGDVSSTEASSSSNPFAATSLNGATSKDGAEKKNDGGDAKPSNPFASASLTANSTDSSSNPFKSTILKASETPKDDEAAKEKTVDAEKKEGGKEEINEGTETSKPKVFGSSTGFSGFKAAASGNGFGFGGFGKNAGNSPSGANGTTGFGAVAASSGFTKTSTSSFFGSSPPSTGFSSASTGPADGKSLFQTSSGAPAFAFTAFSKKVDESKSDDDDDVNPEEEVDVTIEGAPAVNLPEQVQLTTGEEDEEVIHDGRCKSFHWVPKPPEGEETAESTATKANPSVKPSTAFQAVISTSKADKDSTSEEKEDDTSIKEETSTNGDVKKKESKESKEETTKNQLSDANFKWQELGVGPMKILRSTSKEGKYRLVQRRESTPNGPATKVILNVPLWKESTVERTAPKFLTLRTLVDNKVESYSFRFKDSSDASYFDHFLTRSIPDAKAAFAPAD
jgi:NUP50 (Nucleoporin 50 kDa)/RanBP1 domain